MDFVCPVCGKHLPRDMAKIVPHTELHIVDAIKKKNPKWAEKDGTCPKCYAHYKKEMRKDQ